MNNSYEEMLAEYRIMLKNKIQNIIFQIYITQIMNKKFGIMNDPKHGLLACPSGCSE